ncbi:XRE family transcriptional regulator [Paractinoplanes toevensis]|uniref:Uncharacterized protein n=1 Tax=Paractinoplanes toevensis TaxID=571911 RepID=A0A919T5X5_9ACTN|nr:XRE family transcriptional regulator [Actinoplanes toevensis]GIM89768.1 hypothetical protein Ato02nite_015610 [Actinoplanes toevensis]
MTFGSHLARLIDVRGLDAAALAGRAATGEHEIRAVLDGGEPEPVLLRRLAPALGLHRSDLFLIADLPVPDDLSLVDPAARGRVDWLAWSLTYLPGAVAELHEFVGSLPPASRPPAAPPPRPLEQYPPGAGGLVLRLLHNRNLGWSGIAKYLFGAGGGPMLSASTIGMIGRGPKTLTPELLGGFAAVLDLTAGDLAALTDVEPALPAAPTRPGVAALLWDARRLTAAQVDQLHDRAHTIRHERAAEIGAGMRCGCPGPTAGEPRR